MSKRWSKRMSKTKRRMQRSTALRSVCCAALLLAILLSTPAAPAQAAKSTVAWSLCRIDWRDGTREVKRLIRCATRKWHVPGGATKALAVARCESGFDPSAYGSGNAGVFQQAVPWWPGRAKEYGFPGWSVYNGRANVIVSIRMAHRDGWSAWTCA
jgi:hypothetical protein